MRKPISFVGVPTRILERELERRNSIAYARNVNREMRGARELAVAQFKGTISEREAAKSGFLRCPIRFFLVFSLRAIRRSELHRQ